MSLIASRHILLLLVIEMRSITIIDFTNFTSQTQSTSNTGCDLSSIEMPARINAQHVWKGWAQ